MAARPLLRRRSSPPRSRSIKLNSETGENMTVLSDLEKKIILSMAENDLKVSHVCKSLFMCKSTVDYHIDKIKKETGLSPKRFYDMVKLLEL